MGAWFRQKKPRKSKPKGNGGRARFGKQGIYYLLGT